jgi:hypothetical protein
VKRLDATEYEEGIKNYLLTKHPNITEDQKGRMLDRLDKFGTESYVFVFENEGTFGFVYSIPASKRELKRELTSIIESIRNNHPNCRALTYMFCDKSIFPPREKWLNLMLKAVRQNLSPGVLMLTETTKNDRGA